MKTNEIKTGFLIASKCFARIGELLFVLFVSFLCTSANGVENSQGNDVAEFKQYLAQPPCIERMIYTDVNDCLEDAKTNQLQGKYALAFCGDGFYLRNFRENENIDLPISVSNQMQGGAFWGKSVDGTSWQIAGNWVTKSIKPDKAKLERYYETARIYRRGAVGKVNLGMQSLVPGSFVWQGDEFEAIQDSEKKQKRKGRVVCVGGKVTEMYIDKFHYQYEYEPSPERPAWFPSKFTESIDGKCTEVVAYETVKFGNFGKIAAKFLPENHVATNFMLLTVISNSEVIAKPTKSSRPWTSGGGDLQQNAPPPRPSPQSP